MSCAKFCRTRNSSSAGSILQGAPSPTGEKEDGLTDGFSAGADRFVIKEILQDYEIRKDTYRQAGSCAQVRALLDNVPSRRMFVFEYLEQILLRFMQDGVLLAQAKHILKCALRGLASLHERDNVHTGSSDRADL